MAFFMWTMGLPLLLVAGVVLLAVSGLVPIDYVTGAGAVAMLWLGFTMRARRTYWSARIRSRASADGRRARSERA
jgi:membrane-bound ClpP family serine protease